MFYFNDQNRYFGVRTNSVSKSFTQKCVLAYLRSFPKVPPSPPHKLPPGDKVCRLSFRPSFRPPANPLENRAGESVLFPEESKLPLPHRMRTGLFATDEKTTQLLLLQVVKDGGESKKRYQRQKEGPQRTTFPSWLLWALQSSIENGWLLYSSSSALGCYLSHYLPGQVPSNWKLILYSLAWFIPSPSTLFTIQFNSERLLLSTY